LVLRLPEMARIFILLIFCVNNIEQVTKKN
jgi:hypothetical protein